VKYWSNSFLPVEEIRRRAMLYFGKEVAGVMALVSREPERLLFSTAAGDLIVSVVAGRPSEVSVITTHWHAEAQDFLQRMVEPVEGIVHYQTASAQTVPEVLQRARGYFGEEAEGLGLTLAMEEPQSLQFVGGGGHVTVSVHPDDQSQVQVAARQWNYHAEQFVRQISSER